MKLGCGQLSSNPTMRHSELNSRDRTFLPKKHNDANACQGKSLRSVSAIIFKSEFNANSDGEFRPNENVGVANQGNRRKILDLIERNFWSMLFPRCQGSLSFTKSSTIRS